MTPIDMDPSLLLLLIGLLYTLMFGVMSYLRREALSAQFAIESVLLTLLIAGVSWYAGATINPIFFLIFLYLITMRCRILVDLANMLAVRGKFRGAFALYRLSLKLMPDFSARLIVLANQGAAELRTDQPHAAVVTLEGVLREEVRPHLGLKYESACRYNLGVAYERCGEHARATQLLNEVIDLLPGTPHARAAEAALERKKKKRRQEEAP